jgi:hypothetical protein
MSILVEQIAMKERSKKNKNHSIILQICKLQAPGLLLKNAKSNIPSVPLRHGTRFEYRLSSTQTVSIKDKSIERKSSIV